MHRKNVPQKKCNILMTSVILLMAGSVISEEMSLELFDFTQPEPSREWQAMNDGVMGGVSRGPVQDY